MKNLFKKSLLISVLFVAGFSLFAAEEQVAKAENKKSVNFSIAAGLNSKYKIVGEERVDLANTARPVVTVVLENSGDSFLPLKLSVGAMPNQWKFIQGETADGYNAFGTADLRLLSFDGFKIFAGAGAIYDSKRKTEDNKFNDCLVWVANAQMGLKLSAKSQLVVYTQIPFNQVKAYIDQKRGVDISGRTLTEANAGAMLSFEI